MPPRPRRPVHAAPSTPPRPRPPPAAPWLQDRTALQQALLVQLEQELGSEVLHLFYRGFAGAPWLEHLCQHQCRFILRWLKRYKLWTQPVPALSGTVAEQQIKTENAQNNAQNNAAWQHLRGQHSWEHQLVPDARRGQWRKVGVIAVPVFHPAYRQGQAPRFLVAARSGQGKEPGYLLTNEIVESADRERRPSLGRGQSLRQTLANRNGIAIQ